MPDICMCTNTICALKDNCYRPLAKPSRWQSYSFFSPEIKEFGWWCQHQWKMKPVSKEKLIEALI